MPAFLPWNMHIRLDNLEVIMPKLQGRYIFNKINRVKWLILN